MPQSTIATAADYADAMMTARRAKNWLFGLLLLILLGQLAIFFLAYFQVIHPTASAGQSPVAAVVAPGATTEPIVGTAVGAHASATAVTLQFLTGLTDFLGLVFAVILIFVLYLIVKIMLVGRLIGVSKVTSAYIWCIILAFALFPWQAFLNWGDLNEGFQFPGVLFTWTELVQYGNFHGQGLEWTALTLRWARFVLFPVLAILVLVAIQLKSGRGLRMALGETEPETAGRDDLA